MQETWVWSLGREDPLEKGMATHSSILAWRIPWTEEPVGLQSMESQRDWHNWATNAFRHVGSVVVPGLSCPVACGIFRGQESNLLASWFFTARWPGKSPTKYFKCRHYELSKSQKCFHTAFQTRSEKATAASDRVSHQTVSMERLRKSYPADTADVCWMRTQLKKKITALHFQVIQQFVKWTV